MKKYIEKIKQRPIKERKKIASFLAYLSTLIVVIIWLSVMLLSKPYTQRKKSINIKEFEGFVNKIGEQFSDVEAKASEIKNSFDNIKPENTKESNLSKTDIKNIDEIKENI